MNFDNYLKMFNDYYSQFDDSIPSIKMKYEHTLGVVSYAKRISKSLNLSEDDCKLAEICALFHDISRFKQYQKYHTFNDGITFDHGDEGYKMLKEFGINDEIILLSTKYHNKYEVPQDENERIKLFAYITKDADKIDILNRLERVYSEDTFDVSKDVMESIENHELVKNDPELWSRHDYQLLRHLAFIFDLKYKESYKIVKELNLVNLKCDEVLSKINDERVRKTKEILNKYIDERLSD